MFMALESFPIISAIFDLTIEAGAQPVYCGQPVNRGTFKEKKKRFFRHFILPPFGFDI